MNKLIEILSELEDLFGDVSFELCQSVQKHKACTGISCEDCPLNKGIIKFLEDYCD